MSLRKTLLIVCIALAVIALGPFSAMPLVRANAMIPLTSAPQSLTPWVGSNSQLGLQFLYNGVGPAHTTLWSVQVSIGLSGGDNTQYTRWVFTLCDSGGEQFQYRGSAINWESNGNYVYGDTLTASLGSSMCLLLQIYNDDPVSQVYLVSYWAWYY